VGTQYFLRIQANGSAAGEDERTDCGNIWMPTRRRRYWSRQ